MPKISVAQGASYAEDAPTDPDAEQPAQPEPEQMADGSLEQLETDPIPAPSTGIVGTSDGSGNTIVGADTEEHDTLADDDDEDEAAGDGEQDSEQDEGVALPPQNAVKDEWIKALRELGVSDDWIAENEEGKGRTKDDLIVVGTAIRDGDLYVDDDGVPQSAG